MSNTNGNYKVAKSVRVWLFTGVVMVFLQIIIGGVTRLTDSGLSITEWAIIQGTLPPLNQTEWTEAFEKYKIAAKQQFDAIHADMTLAEFKVIFYWEYFHRLWARLMGVVFVIPFLVFYFKKLLPKWLLKGLGLVILFAALAAVFGWIMVDSGLNNEKRTWVNAYALVVHLAIASSLFGVLFWVWLKSGGTKNLNHRYDYFRKLSNWLLALVMLQIMFGGLMAGMRAGLLHPHVFLFIEPQKFWSSISALHEAKVEHFIDYEPTRFVKAVVQLVHRLTAWGIVIFVLWFSNKAMKSSLWPKMKFPVLLVSGVVLMQVLLGILTVINSQWRIPVVWGSVHQAGAFILLAAIIYLHFTVSAPPSDSKNSNN